MKGFVYGLFASLLIFILASIINRAVKYYRFRRAAAAHLLSKEDCVEHGFCIQCGQKAPAAREDGNAIVYRTTGICQRCQDYWKLKNEGKIA